MTSRLQIAALAAALIVYASPVAAQTTPSMAGRAHAVPKAPMLDFTPLWVVEGQVYGDRLGASITDLPDLDGDGLPELLAGAPNRQPSGYSTIGHAFVYSGADGALLREHLGWNDGDRYGHSVAALPDLDGDGVPDYGVGAIWAANLENPSGAELPGRLAIWSGATGLPLVELGGVATYECFGAALASLGDIDHDGVGDLMVTARFGGTPAPGLGHVRLVSGASGATLAQAAGQNPGDWLGTTAIALPDLNGDGLPEVAASAFHFDQQRGQVQVLSGADGSLLAAFEGTAVGERFGRALAHLPDLNGDGKAELAIGAPFAAGGDGRVTIVSPATAQTLFSVASHSPHEQFGTAVVAVGDRNGDGVDELAVGGPSWAGDAGQVVIVSLPTGEVLATLRGTTPDDHFGEALRALPDLTGDGRVELAIGAPTAPYGLALGQVIVVSLE